MANFKTAYDKTAAFEGGWVDHPNDKGKETYAGIARAFFPNWKGWAIVDSYKSKPGFPSNLPKAELAPLVESFFKTNFWDVIRLDEITNQEIAEELYDTGVNFGHSRAIKFAQEACNLLTVNALDVDGKIGPKTITAINSYKYPKVLFNLLNVLQAEAYVENCRKNISQEVFLRGWLTRVTILK